MSAQAFRRWLSESRAAWGLPANTAAHGPGHATLERARRAAAPQRKAPVMSASNGHPRDDLDFLDEHPEADAALREFDLDWSFERNYGELPPIPGNPSGHWAPHERTAALDAIDRRLDRLHDALDR